MATPGNSMATAANLYNMPILLNCNTGNTGNSKISSLINNYNQLPVTPRAYRIFTVASVAAVANTYININYIIILNIYNYRPRIFWQQQARFWQHLATAESPGNMRL